MALPSFDDFLKSDNKAKKNELPSFDDFLSAIPTAFQKATDRLSPMTVNSRNILQQPSDVTAILKSQLPVQQAVQSPAQQIVQPELNLTPIEARAREIPVIGSVLKALDKFNANPIVKKADDIALSLYTPGAGAANIAGFAGSAGRTVAKLLPGLAKSVGGRIAQKAITEAATGFPVATGQSVALEGGNNPAENLKQGAFGAALGLGLGMGGGSINEGLRLLRTQKPPIPSYEGISLAPKREVKPPLSEGAKSIVQPVSELPKFEPKVQPKINPTIQQRTATIEPDLPKFEPAVVKPKHSPEVQAKLDQINADIEEYKGFVERNVRSGMSKERASQDIKGFAMRKAAEKRAVIQGDSLIPIEGGFTPKELTNKINYLKTNYKGKEVIVDGQEGKIKNMSFGKVGVEFPDGNVKYFEQDSVKPKVDVDALVQSQKAPKATNAVQSKQTSGKYKIGEEAIPTSADGVDLSEAKKIIDVQSKDGINYYRFDGENTYMPENMVRKPDPIKAEVNPIQPNAVKALAEHKQPLERGFITTLKESAKNEELKPKLSGTYEQLSNQSLVDAANKRVAELDKAASYVMGSGKFTADKVATGHRLIDEFSKTGQYDRAVDIAERMAEEGTKAGQTIQAFSIYNRLTPEGILIHAERIANRVNEGLMKGQKEVKVTPEIAAHLTDATATMQKMTGVKELSNSVMDIVERAKKGEALTDAEHQSLRQFVNDAKQFVKETTRQIKVKEPSIPKDKRIRDNVVSFLDAQEQAAKERLRNKGIQISSLPLDVYADYAVIGAAKMAKGVVKFADWSEQMIKDLGEEIRPYLEQLYERASETFSQSAKRVSQSTVSQAEKIAERAIKNKNVAPEDAEFIRDLAQKVSGLSGEAKMVASQDLQAVLQRLERPGLLRKIDTTQTLAQLLNPVTHVRNALGNEMFYRLERINKYVSTPIDIVRSKITGGQRTVTFKRNNQGEYWRNWLKGAKAGWQGVNPEGLTTQFDLRPQTFTSKLNPLTYLEKTLGSLLKSFDYAAYKRASNETLGEMATLRAINEGKGSDKELIQKYIRESDDNLHAIANEYGKYVTFQDNNVLSVGLSKVKRGLNFGKDFGIGSLILKYPKTPGALLMRALEYSPAGFLKSAYQLTRPFWSKTAVRDPRAIALSLSQAITGTTGLTGMGYFLADKGIITGEASKDRDVRALQSKVGQGQYQINLSALKRWVLSGFDPEEAKIKEGDHLYSYDWVQPMAIAVSLGANIYQTLHQSAEKKAVGAAGAIYNSLSSGVDTLTNQSVLSGLARAAEGYPGQSITDKIASILSDIPSSFAPSALNKVNQLMDNQKKETYDPNLVKYSLNRALARIPGLAQTLPQKYDTLGKPQEVYQDGGNNLFNVLLNPGFASKYQVTPEAKLVIDLINKTGDTSIAPRVPSKSINIKLDGKTQSVKLTNRQYSEIERLTGEEVSKRLSRINPNYSDDAKIRAIVKALNDAGEKARTELKKQMGVK